MRVLRKILLLSATLFCLLGGAARGAVDKRPGAARAQHQARRILALYDSTYDKRIADTPIHQIVEMPLNHLGLVVEYRDINSGLPRIEDLQDVRGVITWFQSDMMPDPLGYLAWADAMIQAGKKFVVVGELSADRDLKNHITPASALNQFWSSLGLRNEGTWTRITYDAQVVHRDPTMVEFERHFEGILPRYPQTKKIDSNTTSYLTVRRGSDPATDCDLVTTNRNGGYMAGAYAHYYSADFSQRQWYVNPFEYFRVAFNTDELPKPDTTTLMGRRIFYSHVDGDGWRNVTEVPGYKNRRALSSEVVFKEAIRAFPDLPVTVAPIAADLDPTWYGTPESLDLARQILALPNVEAGTHTYSHPLDWEALAKNPDAPGAMGRTFFSIQISQMPAWLQKLISVLWESSGQIFGESRAQIATKRRYESLRSYDLQPFNLDHEIRGSIEFISRLLPAGKKVEVVQWSGDTTPFEAVVAASRTAGVRNINGGATRFDEERMSYGWVFPVGRQVGRTWQIYASNSNENNYTELWTDRFFGFRYLTKTIQNTESPRRVKPINIYYHMYSGEKLASLRALIENLQYVTALEICPITTSQYAAIADGFYSTSIEALDEHRWSINNRGDLETIRFDNSSQYAVDFARSTGIIGQRYLQDTLYVALDAAEASPIVSLMDREVKAAKITSNSRVLPFASRAYLAHSHWRVSSYRQSEAEFSFAAQGYGPGAMQWKLPKRGSVLIRAREHSGREWQKEIATDAEGLLDFTIPLDAHQRAFVTVRSLGDARQ